MTRRLIVIALLAACSKGGEGGGGGKRRGGGKLEYPVDVAKLEQRQVRYTVTAPGTIEAFQQVQITARVAGAVDKVAFVEGQEVKAGDVLVVIESARYQIAVAQAKALYTKAQATQRAAEAALQRRQNAQTASPGLVAGEEIELKQTAVDTAKADVEQAKQSLRVAQLNLRESSVRAPIKGTVQTRTVQQGQYLGAGAVLATILQREPLLLRFPVTELDAPRLKPGMTATFTMSGRPREYTAKITLVADAADPSTRMVPVTAELDATDHDYWLRPGSFVGVSIPVGEARQGIVVPSLAVAPTEQGNMVYVVDAKNQVHARIVELGMRTPEGGVELRSGVQAGETLVIRGIEPLSDGAPVKVKSTTTLEQAAQDAAKAAAKAAP
jgi:RND family efflux transporter MFP subunit